MHLALMATVVSAALGWSDISVAPARSGGISAPWQRSLANLDRPSERTSESLKRYDLADRYRRHPAGALLVLEKFARRAPDSDLVFALAELSWVEARRLERRRKPEALERYVDAVAYAFDFLFDPDLAAGRQPSDPRFRLAMDLYNGGLDQIIRAAKAKGRIEPGGLIALKVHGSDLNLRINLDKSPWKSGEINELLLCSDYEVSGLPTRSYQYGLGVPLIGIRKTDPNAEAEPNGMDRFYPPEMAFPLTAFLRPNSRLRDSKDDVETARDCTLDLLDPVEIRSVVVDSYTLAIEADLTTPLAYMWSRTDLSSYRWKGLFRPGEAAERSGLMLLRPFEPEKIPVVMVHGLMSSPLAWIPMINELLRDPEIQKRYQFFLYVYPTGVQVPIAASYLRDTLLDSRRFFDPNGASPAFNRMVLLGHSMGGLLSHAMAVHSDDKFWALNSDRRFDDLIGPREVLAELEHYNFFEPVPMVERVVFLATPHRGSDFARRAIGRIGSSLISDPDQYSNLLTRLIRDNPDAFDSRRFRRMPTSIDTLDSDAPVLLALLGMRPKEGVVFHSIIGSKYPVPLADTTDGVVAYQSAHLEGVKSERVVRSDHSVQRDPEAILEVRRILIEHLGAAGVAAPTSRSQLPPVEVMPMPTFPAAVGP